MPLESFGWHDKLPYEYISVEKIKTGTYFEPEGYELFVIPKDKGKIELEILLEDQDDQLTKGHNGFNYDKNFANSNIGSLTEDVRDCLDGSVDYVFDGSSYNNIEALEYALLETSRITDITTGIYNNGGPYDLYLMSNQRENIMIAENLDASITHKFDLTALSLDEGEHIKGYKVVFKTPASLASFTSGSLLNRDSHPPHTYSLYLATDKKPLFLWKEGLSSNLNYDLSFLELNLGKEESIKDIKLLFHEAVLPGLKTLKNLY